MIFDPANHQVTIGSWHELQSQALPLRVAVFVQEQGVPAELEYDEFDQTATHAVVLGPHNQAIATGRLLLTDQGLAKIGRLAVDRSHRGEGLGKLILMALVEHAKSSGASIVKLHARCDAEQFYQRLGFEVRGERFMEAGTLHVLMVLKL